MEELVSEGGFDVDHENERCGCLEDERNHLHGDGDLDEELYKSAHSELEENQYSGERRIYQRCDDHHRQYILVDQLW